MKILSIWFVLTSSVDKYSISNEYFLNQLIVIAHRDNI